ncbi:DUF3991 and toprim domain-containing protein [Bacillus smithii]|uniref:DUF3991 and toprim domain-containing protein n=1 Tax=Bacillus smithii TaxID=1479 RepID=UPI002E1BBD64|nr:DUF3991 and toprim domain-containing protein [Bacillus smithii]
MKVNKDLIRQARQANLADYLLKRGEPLKRDGHKRFRHKEHDSLVFTENAFYWNATGQKGNAIDFLMLFYGMDFKTAVQELTGQHLETQDLETKKELALAPKTKQVPVSDNFVLTDLNKDMRRTFAYLIKTRLIDTSIVHFLAKEKLLFQDTRGNAVFPWLNEKRQIVGAELHGTLTEKRFKSIVNGSKHGYGYNIVIGSPRALYAFESAIDLLSFWSLNKGIKDALLVSMGGLKMEVLEGFLKRHTSLSETFLCVDNDKAGQAFIKAVQAKITAKTAFPPKGKDWNEYLKIQKVNRS